MDKVVFDRFAGKIGRALTKTTGDRYAHVHFYIKGKSDSIVLIYLNGMPDRIVAKGKECGKGECLAWNQSEFGNIPPDEVFLIYFERIRKIIIDHPKFKRSWRSLDKFTDWVAEM